jgi:hypothetical protein
MIPIEKNASGKFVIALSDKIPAYIDDDYEFIFNNDTTKESITLNLNDVSIHKERYSEFDYDINDFQNANTGFYTYKIYYHSDLIATGKMLLFENLPSDITQYSGYNGEAIVYEK